MNGQTELTITVERSRAIVFGRYHWVLGLHHRAIQDHNWQEADKRQGELLGLAYALGALGLEEDLPQ